MAYIEKNSSADSVVFKKIDNNLKDPVLCTVI